MADDYDINEIQLLICEGKFKHTKYRASIELKNTNKYETNNLVLNKILLFLVDMALLTYRLNITSLSNLANFQRLTFDTSTYNTN